MFDSMDSTARRRVLYLAGSIGIAGVAGFATASDHEKNDGHDFDKDKRGHDKDDIDSEGPFNDADILFMQGMIPHHEQAIEMAELIPGRTDREELCELGPEIIEVQEAEIKQLNEWLAEAGVDPDDHDMAHEDMDGVLTDDEMDDLREAEDQEFDCLFAEYMIRHHEGAIVMSEEVLEEGRSRRVADLATEIIDVQQEEIEMMACWRVNWGC